MRLTDERLVIGPNTLPLEGHRVLVIEDEYVIANDFVTALTRAGASVDGPSASVAEVQTIPPLVNFNLAVLEINLRGQDVYPLAQRLTDTAIPFMFSPGYAGPAIREPWRMLVALTRND